MEKLFNQRITRRELLKTAFVLGVGALANGCAEQDNASKLSQLEQQKDEVVATQKIQEARIDNLKAGIQAIADSIRKDQQPVKTGSEEAKREEQKLSNTRILIGSIVGAIGVSGVGLLIKSFYSEFVESRKYVKGLSGYLEGTTLGDRVAHFVHLWSDKDMESIIKIRYEDQQRLEYQRYRNMFTK